MAVIDSAYQNQKNTGLRLAGNSWLIILLGALLVCGLWYATWKQLAFDYDRTLAETSRETMNVAIGFEEHVRRILYDADKDLLILKQAFERDGISSPIIAAYTETGTAAGRNQVAIYNKEGFLVRSFIKGLPVTNYSDRSYFQVQRDSADDTLFIGPPIQLRASGQTAIPLTRRINNPDGSFAGIVYIGLRTDYFLEFYKKMDMGQDQLIALVGLDWTVRARQSGDNLEVGQDVTGSPLWKNVQLRPVGTYVTNDVLDTFRRVVSYRVMPDYPLVFAIGKTTKVAFAGYDGRKRAYIAGVSLVSLFILGFCGLLVNRFERERGLNARMARTVNELQLAGVKLGEQAQLLQEVNATLEEEIMERQAAQESLRKLNAGLESKVAERTAELQEINATLEEEIMERQSAQAVLAATNKELSERERQLRRSLDELTETNKELTSFTNSIAHDFRSPMVNLKGFSHELGSSLTEVNGILHDSGAALPERARQRISELLDKEVPEALQFIYSSVDRLDNMVNAMLELARLGRREPGTEEVNMESLVAKAVQAHKHEIDAKMISVTVGHLPKVATNQIAMEQIMGNLIDNAIKYLGPDVSGEITVTSSEAGDEYVFSVEDNGRGIAEEDQEKIFQVFRRAGVQDMPGDGMGLAYVRTLIRKLGGKVWCESELGAGTTMKFTVPKFRLQ